MYNYYLIATEKLKNQAEISHEEIKQIKVWA